MKPVRLSMCALMTQEIMRNAIQWNHLNSPWTHIRKGLFSEGYLHLRFGGLFSREFKSLIGGGGGGGLIIGILRCAKMCDMVVQPLSTANHNPVFAQVSLPLSTTYISYRSQMLNSTETVDSEYCQHNSV